MPVSTLTNKDASSPAAVSATSQGLSSWGRKNKVLFISIIVLMQILGLMVVEGVLYLAGIGEEDISVSDPEIGFRHRKNKRVTWRQEGYSQSYFGDDGLREPASAKKVAGTYRILLLGDSFVEGLQEPHEFSFGEQLERRLSGQLHRPVEVLNFGTVGFSTVQEYLMLQQMLPKYKADAVMLCYTPRDMAETLESWAPANMKPVGSRPYALKMPGKPLEISNAPVLNAAALPSAKWWSQFEWLRQNSHIWGYFSINKPKITLKNSIVEAVGNISRDPSDGLWQLVKPVMSSASPSFQIQFFEQNQKKNEATRLKRANAEAKHRSDLDSDPTGVMRKTHLQALDDTFGELLKGMNQLCHQHNAKLLVFFTPCRSALLPPTPSVPAPAPPLYNVSYLDEIGFVTRHCKQLGVPSFDCHSAAAKHSPSEIEKMFFVHHPNRNGNKFLCDQATNLLLKEMSSKSSVMESKRASLPGSI